MAVRAVYELELFPDCFVESENRSDILLAQVSRTGGKDAGTGFPCGFSERGSHGAQSIFCGPDEKSRRDLCVSRMYNYSGMICPNITCSPI